MNVRYTVHSSHVTKVAVSVPYNGQTVEALVDGLVVELVAEDGTMGHTFRFVPEDLAAAQALYEVGATIVASHAREG